MFELTDEKILIEQYRNKFANPQVGGVVIFEGIVRNHNDGKNVASLEYEVYPEMALSEGQKILHQSLKQFSIEDAFCVHRHGHLAVGEIAVLVMAFAKHRKEAFDACEFIINQVKLTVPVWKKEHYSFGPSVWVACHRCQNPAEGHIHREI